MSILICGLIQTGHCVSMDVTLVEGQVWSNFNFALGTATSSDPYGPFGNHVVAFRGSHEGGSGMRFAYELNFDQPVSLDSISFNAAGDFSTASAKIRDHTGTEVGNLNMSDPLGHHITVANYVVDPPPLVGTTFTLELYDASTIVTLVSNIRVAANGGPINNVTFSPARNIQNVRTPPPNYLSIDTGVFPPVSGPTPTPDGGGCALVILALGAIKVFESKSRKASTSL